MGWIDKRGRSRSLGKIWFSGQSKKINRLRDSNYSGERPMMALTSPGGGLDMGTPVPHCKSWDGGNSKRVMQEEHT